MNLRDLRYLVAVAEHRNFGRAAQACFVSQPTLSTQLKKLEETLGVTLVERTNRRVMLTPEGEQIVAQAQRILVEVNSLTAMSEQLQDPRGGELRLGVIPTVAPYVLPRLLSSLRAVFPNLHIKLTEGQTDHISRLLKQGEVDVNLLALPLGEENVDEFPIYDEPFFYAVPHDHPLADRARVSTGDLEGQEVLLLEDGHCLRDQALEVCQAHRGIESQNYSATSLETLRQLVASGFGTTLIPEFAVKSYPHAGDHVPPIRYLPFDGKAPSRQLGLCWRSTSTRKDLLRDLAAQLRDMMRPGAPSEDAPRA